LDKDRLGEGRRIGGATLFFQRQTLKRGREENRSGKQPRKKIYPAWKKKQGALDSSTSGVSRKRGGWGERRKG